MPETASPPPIVVGLDGQDHTRDALDWALAEAVRRRCGMHLVHGRSVPVQGPHIEPLMATSDAVAKRVLTEATQRIRGVSGAIEVTTSTGIGSPAALLVEASRSAQLVVVGARGRGALASAFLGSTSLDVAAHAHCPVTVVRTLPPTSDPGEGVVVGYDTSDLSDAALGEGFRQAEQRGLPLTVVHTWTVEYADTGMVVLDPDELRSRLGDQVTTATEEAVAAWSEKYPQVRVRSRVLDAHPVSALVEASRDAALVVVGSRGLGGFRGMLLGSVSQGVLHGAHCPVMVVRP
ncbi:universal stress protein [Pedococcus sp. KACC 23699]|uniref:Universal stress protein n=1 Tax=Pedococcus sp. KACC 23699 TaxID=3149228 RepID=A0AAU7JS50_9MICO